MATLSVNSSSLGTPLMTLLKCDSIQPGSAPSYEICKITYEFHPLGAKIVEAPILMAQSQQREIEVSVGPKEKIIKAFLDERERLGADKNIFNLVRLSRAYGIACIAMIVKGEDSAAPIDYTKLWSREVSFNVFDPMNTAGSLVLNQQPNDPDFMKPPGGITVQGQVYHNNRIVLKLNEEPIYLGYTTSAFGYVGRSSYQRILYPLKSFIQTMITDDMVTRKAGLIVAMIKAVGSIANQIQSAMQSVRRSLLKEAETNNVISIDIDEKIESIDLQNVNMAMEVSRKNVLNNIAAGANMPAIMLNEETYANGFGEGSEDARQVASFITQFRDDIAGAYAFFDTITQYRAWSPEFFETVKTEYPELYKNTTYEQAFYEWVHGFKATWPNLLTEPDSEKAKAEDVKQKAVVAIVATLMPIADPVNKAILINWVQDNINQFKLLFSSPLVLDAQAMAEYVPPPPPGMEGGEGGGGEGGAPKPPKPESSNS